MEKEEKEKRSRLPIIGPLQLSLMLQGAIQFAVTKLFGTGSQVPLLLVIDAI
jgi:hypothetical protein